MKKISYFIILPLLLLISGVIIYDLLNPQSVPADIYPVRKHGEKGYSNDRKIKNSISKLSNGVYTVQIKNQEVKLELALTETERRKGLMYRSHLPNNTGMLFIYPDERYLSFWMKNTLIPLSIAFIKADGTITQVESMQPLDTTSLVSGAMVKYALEMPEGWFDRNGISVGDKITWPNLIKNLRPE